MKILIFAPYAGSDQHGMVFRNYAHAREWVRQGHEVTLVASSFSHTRSKQPETSGRVTEQNLDGIRYLWVWGPVYRQSRTLGRVFSMMFYTLQCLFTPLSLTSHYDVIVASSPHPFSIYPAYRLACRFKAKLIYDIRDLWPLTLIRLGRISPRHPFIWLMQKAENFACRHADLVVAVPRGCEDYLRKHGLPPGKFLHISNGVLQDDREKRELPEDHRILLGKLKAENGLIVGYAGAIGLANALHVLLSAVAGCDLKISVVIMGHGGCLEDLKRQSVVLGIAERVHFLVPVNKDQVGGFLKLVDVAYAGTLKSSLYEYGASLTKMNDYMLANKPILYAVGDPGNVVEASGCGVSCDAENISQIIVALEQFVSMSEEELLKMGTKGKGWCLNHHMVSQQVVRILEAVG